jgi:hypothetical protein
MRAPPAPNRKDAYFHRVSNAELMRAPVRSKKAPGCLVDIRVAISCITLDLQSDSIKQGAQSLGARRKRGGVGGGIVKSHPSC